MTPDENLVLHCYTITFVKSFKANGEEFADPKGPKLKQIVRLMLKSQDFDNRRNSIVTDFQQSLISLEKLPGEIQNQRVEYYHEADGAARANAQTYDLHIVPVRDFEELRIADLIAFLTSTTTTAQYPAKVLMVQALNTLIGHHTNSNQTTTVIGGKRAFPSNALDKSLGGDLIAKRGFFSSVRLASHRPLVNVNISHGAFYNAIGLAAIMDNWRVEEFVRRDQWEELETFVKGLKVKTNYLKDGSGHQITMVKTISGFAHEADGYGQRPRPMVPNVPFGSPFQVFFLLKDSGEYAKVTSGRDRQYHPSSAGYENREYWKTLRDRGPGFLSVAEFFGESALYPCIFSLRLLTPHRTWCMDSQPGDIPRGQCWIKKGPHIHTC